MTNSIQLEIDTLKAKLANLENEAKLQDELKGLPAKYGFSDLNSFIKALKRAAAANTGNPVEPQQSTAAVPAAAAQASKKASAKKSAKKRGKRTRITPELKEQVKAAVVAGKTGAEISKEFGISLPSIQNIKKQFGLVKARS